MIAYKVLYATGASTNQFDERHIGGSGGQPDMSGYIVSTNTTNVTITLPPASVCEGRVIHFCAINPSSKSVQINPAGSDPIIVTAGATAAVSAIVPFAQTIMTCDGTRWWLHGDGSFA